jgi:hypothetical protein
MRETQVDVFEIADGSQSRQQDDAGWWYSQGAEEAVGPYITADAAVTAAVAATGVSMANVRVHA